MNKKKNPTGCGPEVFSVRTWLTGSMLSGFGDGGGGKFASGWSTSSSYEDGAGTSSYIANPQSSRFSNRWPGI